MLNKMGSLLVLSGLLVLLAGCAGQAKIGSDQERRNIVAKQYRFYQIDVHLTEAAKAKEAVNKYFDRKQFVSVVKDRFKKEGLMKSNAGYRIEFHISNLHVRGAIKTIFIPSKDVIAGEAVVHGRDGTVVERFPVDATYVIGGTANAIPQMRARLVYSNFAKIVANVFTGKDPNKLD